MKKVAVLSALFVGAAGGAVGIGASQYSPTYPPGTMIGQVPVGGLDAEGAARRLRIWWDGARLLTVAIENPKIEGMPNRANWAELGLRIDDQASVAQLTLESFWGSASRTIGIRSEPQKVPPIFSLDEGRYEKFAIVIQKASIDRKPAKAQWNGKQVLYSYEIAPMTLDKTGLGEAVKEAWFAQATSLSMPTTEDKKSVANEELEKIKEPMATFSTKFPTYKVTRCQNIELAAKTIDGTVLMPGQTFSFNEFLGPRTTAKGYKIAGVFANGRHDVGVGGGICQVSTTLYNALALSGLKIVQRSNHSMAVTYVPIGRDAAVSFPNPDLKFINNFDFPIALDSVYQKGQLTFTVLGIKDKTQEISIERTGVSSWGRGVKYQHDPSLPYGKVRLIDAGGAGHKATTYRIYKQNGKVVKRELLHVSQYPGSPRLYGKNMSAKPAAKSPASAPEAAPAPITPDPNSD